MTTQDWVDTTPHRISHAESVGLNAEVVDIYSPKGIIEGKRRHIERIFDMALRYGWISAEQKMAGDRFIYHVVAARYQLQFTTSKLELIDSSHDCRMDRVLRNRTYHLKELRRSLEVIDQSMRWPFLNWTVASEERDVSINELGAKFTKLKHREAVKSLGIYILGVVLDNLAKFYGYL